MDGTFPLGNFRAFDMLTCRYIRSTCPRIASEKLPNFSDLRTASRLAQRLLHLPPSWSANCPGGRSRKPLCSRNDSVRKHIREKLPRSSPCSRFPLLCGSRNRLARRSRTARDDPRGQRSRVRGSVAPNGSWLGTYHGLDRNASTGNPSAGKRDDHSSRTAGDPVGPDCDCRTAALSRIHRPCPPDRRDAGGCPVTNRHRNVGLVRKLDTHVGGKGHRAGRQNAFWLPRQIFLYGSRTAVSLLKHATGTDARISRMVSGNRPPETALAIVDGPPGITREGIAPCD